MGIASFIAVQNAFRAASSSSNKKQRNYKSYQPSAVGTAPAPNPKNATLAPSADLRNEFRR
jgi:hypothetical protein